MIITSHCYRSRFSFAIMGNIPATVIMRGNISHVNRICEKINKMRFLTGFIDKNQSPGNHCYLFSAINSATA